MAHSSHDLVIAKAAFTVNLLRPDPVGVSQDEINTFHGLLRAVVVRCSPANVQSCRRWVAQNVLPSTARCTALGSLLKAYTVQSTPGPASVNQGAETTRIPSLKRQRLHVLYLVNDLLYHAKHHRRDASVCGKLQPVLVDLFANAASFANCPKQQAKLRDLLELWREQQYFPEIFMAKLGDAIDTATVTQANGRHVDSAAAGEAGSHNALAGQTMPYIMPAMHGDSSTPWYDLPAGNLMPHIVPGSSRPINPELIQPLRLAAGPADESLIAAVEMLLDDVQTIFGQREDHDFMLDQDVDEMGQVLPKDKSTGEAAEVEGYYGWSRSFCENMKKRRRGGGSNGHNTRRARSHSAETSPRPPRRRASSSSDDTRRPARWRHSRRISSRSPSRSPPRSPDRSRLYEAEQVRMRSIHGTSETRPDASRPRPSHTEQSGPALAPRQAGSTEGLARAHYPPYFPPNAGAPPPAPPPQQMPIPLPPYGQAGHVWQPGQPPPLPPQLYPGQHVNGWPVPPPPFMQQGPPIPAPPHAWPGPPHYRG